MSANAQRLAEIDEELAAFGKTSEELAEVIARACALAGELSSDSGLGELLEGREEAIARARSSVELPERPEAPLSVPTRVGTRSPDGEEDDDEPEIEISAASESELPEFDPFGDEDEEETTGVTSAADLEAAFGANASSDIAGMSVDELFADAAPNSDIGGLSDLFDDAPQALSMDSELSSLEGSLEGAELVDEDDDDIEVLHSDEFEILVDDDVLILDD